MYAGKRFLLNLQSKLSEKDALLISQVVKDQGFRLINRYFNYSIQLNIVGSHLTYKSIFKTMKKLMKADKVWQLELTQINRVFDEIYEGAYFEVEKENRTLALTLRESIEQELMDLPLNLDLYDEIVEGAETGQIENLMESIKKDVKQGNRVTFKLLQELQHMFEKMEKEASSDLQATVTASEEAADKQMDKLVSLLLDTFDLLDLVMVNAQKHEDASWKSEISQVVDKGLVLLSNYGIEEVPVLDQPFDGSLMEGIGTVGIDEVVGNYEQYDVHSVFHRGFRFKHNQQLIRRAKVITVY